MSLPFTDGITVDTSGELRTKRLPDGLYVVGEGMLISVADHEEAAEVISKMSGIRSGDPGDPRYCVKCERRDPDETGDGYSVCCSARIVDELEV